MTAELTQEEIVTNLLSSNEIIRKNNANFYITSPANLGEYLNKVTEECIEESITDSLSSKYTFIKDGKWKF